MLKEHQHGMSFWGALAEMKKIVVIPSFAIIILQVKHNSHVCGVCFCTQPSLMSNVSRRHLEYVLNAALYCMQMHLNSVASCRSGLLCSE